MGVASGKGDGEPPALISESTCGGVAQGTPGPPFSSRVNSPFFHLPIFSVETPSQGAVGPESESQSTSPIPESSTSFFLQ